MNRLQYEKSPYLLQHRDNPVEWYSWGEEALTKAISEDKPILLSIGYSSCHWCHVMERESFTDKVTAQYMNEHFINIKLDREERPDLDKIYMDAIVALSGSGGWPLNVFLLPDRRPFYGGTYFPPQSMQQRPSWMQILQYIVQIFKSKRKEVEEQADRLIQHIGNTSNTLFQVAKKPLENQNNITSGEQIFLKLKTRLDRTWGGFGGAPKFPAIMSHRFLLDYYFFSGDQDALRHVIHSLNTMSRAGIYDQIAGGFARYATDKEWNIPHFEKMLYDNAQLISLYSIAYKVAPSTFLKRVVSESYQWLIDEMRSLHGGYYSAIDADSEHEEGKYYIWTEDELKSVLNEEEFKLIHEVYEIESNGNWIDTFHDSGTPKNILWVRKDIDESILNSIELSQIKEKLLNIRRKRIPPLTDTKIILAWNALLVIGLFDAYDAFGEEKYLQSALSLIHFLDNHLLKENNYLHQFDSTIPPMLDDLAYFITACIHGYRSTGDASLLDRASLLVQYVVTHYYDSETNEFNYSISANDMIASANDLYDNTMPSASGAMCYNLIQLGRILNNDSWEELGNKSITKLDGAIIRYPESLSHWASLLQAQSHGWMEIKTGKDINRGEILDTHIPSLILHDEQNDQNEGISFCHDFSCEMPVGTVQEFRLLLDKHYHRL